MKYSSRVLARIAVGLALVVAAWPAKAQTAGKRVQVEGELVDTWCAVTGIMFAFGTAHHQCAVWCAAGGVPVSIRDKDGNFYMVLRLEEEDTNVSNPRYVRIESHQVSVDGELIERDGLKYLFVTKVLDDKGVVNLTHAENGIQPFGE